MNNFCKSWTLRLYKAMSNSALTIRLVNIIYITIIILFKIFFIIIIIIIKFVFYGMTSIPFRFITRVVPGHKLTGHHS